MRIIKEGGGKQDEAVIGQLGESEDGTIEGDVHESVV